MPMEGDGLVKLIEECGELTQIAAKKLTYFYTDVHPDGKGSLDRRLEDEIADVIAACRFVEWTFSLDSTAITERVQNKINTYIEWHREVKS